MGLRNGIQFALNRGVVKLCHPRIQVFCVDVAEQGRAVVLHRLGGARATIGLVQGQAVLDFKFERLSQRRVACLFSFDGFCHHSLFGTVLDVTLLNVVGDLADL